MVTSIRKILRQGAVLTATILIASTALTPQNDTGTRRIPQFENDEVRVWKSIVTPNAPLAMHRHEHARVLIPIVGGTMKIVQEKGGSETYNWETGKPIWLTADPPNARHADVNAGKNTMELIVVELKNDKK